MPQECAASILELVSLLVLQARRGSKRDTGDRVVEGLDRRVVGKGVAAAVGTASQLAARAAVAVEARSCRAFTGEML